ncbi:MAG: hypothetical protein SGPRY_011437 [Prymnesium sp.]
MADKSRHAPSPDSAGGHSHSHETHEEGEGCCEQHAKQRHASDHQHAHNHHNKTEAQAAPSSGSQWLTSQQYKGIGKYLKPWGKPPTGTTFWIQIITTAAVIIISILKGVESTVAIVVSTGPATVHHAEENPMVLASGIVFSLFALVLGTGYLLARRAASAPPPEEEMEPAVKEVTPRAGKAKEKDPSSTVGHKKKSARMKAQLAEEMKARDVDLIRMRQEVLAQSESEGLSAAETKKRMSHVEQEHQDRVVLTERIQRVQEKAEKEGASQARASMCGLSMKMEEIHMRVNETIHVHEEMRKMRAVQAKELLDIEQEAVKEKCLPAEVRRRVHSRKQAHAAELAASDRHREIVQSIVQLSKVMMPL